MHPLAKAHIKYLEHRCYLLAKQADRYILENSTVPADASLTEAEQAEMEEFLYNIRLIINALGHKILESVVESGSDSAADIDAQYRYIQAVKGADATGINTINVLTSGKAEIFNAAGARIPSLQKGVNIIRTADGKTSKVLVK